MLTDTAVKNATLTPPRKISDKGGLYLEITATGTKLWRVAYRFHGKQKTLYLDGAYPALTLGEARIQRDTAKAQLAKGLDPGQQKQVAKRCGEGVTKPTFRFVAQEWYATKVIGEGLSDSVREASTRRMNRLNAVLGDMVASEIEPADVLRAISGVQKQQKHCEANRTRGVASQIMCYGIPYGYCVRDAAADLASAMVSETANSKSLPGLTDAAAFGKLLRDVANYNGQCGNVTGLAIKFLALTVVRPGKELTRAEWSEFDFKEATWTIPKSRMKEREGGHMVPLSRQALAILKELHAITGKRRYAFSLSKDEPMARSTINNALRNMKYDTENEHCGHGFRTSFSTMLNREYRDNDEKVWHDDVIELQLAHLEGSTRKVYFRMGPDALWKPRSNMMQHWADRIDVMRDGGNVVPMTPTRRKAAAA
jgi:integrase